MEIINVKEKSELIASILHFPTWYQSKGEHEKVVEKYLLVYIKGFSKRND